MDDKITLNQGRTEAIAEIAGVLGRSVKADMTLRQFGEMFVSLFCQPAMKQTLNDINQIKSEICGYGNRN